MPNLPLTGLKVIELAGLGPVPFAGMMLADMGAEVILVEKKLPHMSAADPAANREMAKQVIFNRGKKSIAVDLKSEPGRELILKLVEDADFIMEGFRPGVVERLGVGPEVCFERNKKLIYGRMTGWGQTGPLSHAAGHDPNYIGLSGALWYGGGESRAPRAPLSLVGDVGGGSFIFVWGLLCAYLESLKSGEGQVVDSAITDGSAYLSSLLWVMRNIGQIQDELGKGWPDGAAPWNDTYKCADDGYINICSLEPQFYQELIQKLGLGNDEVFKNQWDMSFWPEGKQKLAELFASKNRDHWCELLEGTDVCFSPVLNFEEASEHPHNKARNTFLNIDGVIQPAPAPKFSRSKPSVGVPPGVGEHTEQVLESVGYSRSEIEQFRNLGVVL